MSHILKKEGRILIIYVEALAAAIFTFKSVPSNLYSQICVMQCSFKSTRHYERFSFEIYLVEPLSKSIRRLVDV